MEPLADEDGMLKGGLCTPSEIIVTLKYFGKVPFLTIVGQDIIQLSSPSSDLYVGKHTGIITYYDDSDKKLSE